MNFRGIIVLALLGALTACGHLRSTPVETGSIHGQVSSEEQSNEPEQAKYNTIVDELSVESHTPVVKETDLIARIRSGFKFPKFKSRHIRPNEKWSSEHPTYLNDLLVRAEPFLYYIVEEIEQRGLPMELVLLPAIESSYKPNAVSRSAASGLWQFIPSTGKYYGLRQDWWYDGRLDALAATSSALDYLTKLNKKFDGDWLLTLAAYNAGPGTISKAIKYNKRKRRPTHYQALKLRSETERYVPKLYALRNIILDPEKYGVTLPKIDNEPHFEIVTVPGQIDLAQFADYAGIDLAVLKHLNAGFIRWATSPDGPHRLLLPIDAMDRVDQALERLQREPKISFKNHAISQGDTLSAIARRYGVSVSALQQTNKLRGSSIRAGHNLIIPVTDDAANYQLSMNGANLKNSTELVHRVVEGDTLWSIARRYQVKVAELLNWNNLNRNKILNLNQTLLVYPGQG
jgi:membrane-bound lytic murein transglycosylase D